MRGHLDGRQHLQLFARNSLGLEGSRFRDGDLQISIKRGLEHELLMREYNAFELIAQTVDQANRLDVNG